MHTVVIYRCPNSERIRDFTDDLVSVLRGDDVEPDVEDGHLGEFGVEVDGRLVAYILGDRLPTLEQVRSAVEDAIWQTLPEPSAEHEAYV